MDDKFTHKDKSILLSDIDKQHSKHIVAANELKNMCTQSHLNNIIFNKLYDENVFMQSNDDNDIPKTVLQIEHFECTNESIAENTVDGENSLFAENHGYDIVPSSENMLYTEPFEQNDQTFNSIKMNQRQLGDTYQHLTGIDLLNFAKQIATGMVCMINILHFIYSI